jgi:hypothetical protein
MDAGFRGARVFIAGEGLQASETRAPSTSGTVSTLSRVLSMACLLAASPYQGPLDGRGHGACAAPSRATPRSRSPV